MRLHPCHKGHRFRPAGWNLDQYLDIRSVTRLHVVAVDETGKQVVFQRNDKITSWIHMGASPEPLS